MLDPHLAQWERTRWAWRAESSESHASLARRAEEAPAATRTEPESSLRDGSYHGDGDVNPAPLKRWQFNPPSLERAPHAIRNKSVEHMVVYFLDGTVMTKQGVQRELQLTPADRERVRASGMVIIVHNHPFGDAPSAEDFDAAAKWNLAEFWVVTPDGWLFKCKRPPEGWPPASEMFSSVTLAYLDTLEWLSEAGLTETTCPKSLLHRKQLECIHKRISDKIRVSMEAI